MTDTDTPAGTSRGSLSLKACFGWLTLALVVVLLAAGAWSFERHGESGLVAALVAFAVCWTAGAAALAITGLARTPERAMHGLLLSMLVRMGLPLAAGIVLQGRGGPLAEANVFGLIVVFYLVMLAVEAFLSVRLVKQTAKT